MANYTRNTLSGVLSPVNSELEKIEVSLQKKLDRAPSVSQPNQLEDVLDANSNRIINLAPPESPNDAVRLKDLQESGNSSVIPPQEGQAGEFLKTDGQTAFWDVVDKDSLGLGNVDNTSDVNKPISAATQSELNKKASYVQTFSGLASLSPSTNDVFVCIERANAEYIVQPSGYVALAGDVTFTNGLIGKLQILEWANDRWFANIQDAVDRHDNVLVTRNRQWEGITINRDGVTLKGVNNPKLLYQLATGNHITIGDDVSDIEKVTIEGIWFAQSIFKTADAVIRINRGANIKLRDLHITDCFDGVYVNGIARSEFTDIWFGLDFGRTLVPANKCFSLNANSSGMEVVNLKMTRCDGVNPHGLGTFIYVTTSDWVDITQCHVNLADYFLHIEQTAEHIRNVWVTDCYMDMAFKSNVLINGNGSGICDGIKLTSNYFRASVDDGITINGTGQVDTVIIQGNNRFQQSEKLAINCTNESVINLVLRGAIFTSDIGTSSTYPIIHTSALRNTIESCSFIGNSASVDVDASRTTQSGYIRIVDNDFNASSSAIKATTSNFSIVKQRGNLGLNDFPPMQTATEGQTTVTTDGSGLATITHGLSFTPTYVDVALRAVNSEAVKLIGTPTATTFDVYLYEGTTGAPLSSTSRAVFWNAIRDGV